MTNTLRRVELQGFKSFAPKTALEFPARVTAIVGPNGSGKSNIIDALRWVLGEREAKHLRGNVLENLIFAGTPKRAASGFARVSLLLDNHTRLFPYETEEVALERKVDRSGTSEFRLGGSEVRLKDMVPLLARAKLGSRGLTMVGQGQSDIFVRSSPEERRAMVEEILGLREFRLKKDQAERQLASSRVNMEKVGAMLEELSPHLRFLRRQRHRFEKRSEIEQTLRELEDAYFAFRAHGLREARKAAEEPEGELTAEGERLEKEIGALERALTEAEERVHASDLGRNLREELARAIEKRGTLERELARIEARLEFETKGTAREAESVPRLLGILRELSEDFGALLALEELTPLKERLSRWRERIRAVLERRADKEDRALLEAREAAAYALTAVGAEIERVRRAEDALMEEQRKVGEEFRERVHALEAKKGELSRLERALQEKRFEREKLNLKFEELEHEWRSAGRDPRELEALPFRGPVERGEAERKMMRLRGELAAIGEIDEALVKEAEETEARYTFLSRELEDLKKASADLRKLIKELEEKIHKDFKSAFHAINEEFNNHFRLMFGGGRARLMLVRPEPTPTVSDVEAPTPPEEGVGEGEKQDPELSAGIEVELSIPKKKITSLDMLSGGERSLVSLAALFALIAVSPPPFLVLDEIDAALDDENARRFAELVKEFAKKTQFLIVTHNRATMEVADVLYGITMEDDGVSKVLSLKLE